MGAAACGVHNILCLTGDDPKAGDQPQTKAVFDVDSVTLTAMARELRDKGELPSGRKVLGRASFFLGAADVPIDPPPSWRPDKLAAKLAAGAEFVQTQFCMDAGVVRRYAARLLEHAPTRGVFLLIGVAPLRSARSAGSAIVMSIIQTGKIDAIVGVSCLSVLEKAFPYMESAAIPGVAGVHLMAPANEDALPRVITEARKRQPSR